MDITFHLYWWVIPTIILVVGTIWALFVVKGHGFFGALDNLFAMLPVLVISLISFIIAGALK